MAIVKFLGRVIPDRGLNITQGAPATLAFRTPVATYILFVKGALRTLADRLPLPSATRTANRVRNWPAPRSVLRVLHRSAKGAARTAKGVRNSLAPRSVLRVFHRSAKGAARTAKGVRNSLAPRSVLRVFHRS
jgi:hypothetical protein